MKTKYKFIDDKNTGCLIFPRRIIIETPVGRHIVKGQLVSLGHYHFNGEGKLLTQTYIHNIHEFVDLPNDTRTMRSYLTTIKKFSLNDITYSIVRQSGDTFILGIPVKKVKALNEELLVFTDRLEDLGFICIANRLREAIMPIERSHV